MLNREQIESHFMDMKNLLSTAENQKNVILSSEWANQFPSEAGIYTAFENGKIGYLGESGNIRGRFKDLLDSRHYDLRRNFGKLNSSSVDGYSDADSYNKFPSSVEEKVNSLLMDKIKISVLFTDIGRLDLEEKLIDKFHPKYNKKEKRKRKLIIVLIAISENSESRFNDYFLFLSKSLSIHLD
jgi:hypothetical protein